MKDYRIDILDIHKKIEEDLDFILDVDNLSVKKYYDMLDELDSNYINIEEQDEERLITLYNTEKEGLEYLNKLNKLLLFIKKNTIELHLKKIKILLRRKKKKEELLIILRLLKKWEEFYNEHKKEYSKQEQEKIENYFENIKNIQDEKVVIKKGSIKDKIKLTTMIGITEAVGACKIIIPKKDKKKIVQEVKIIETEEKITKDIKITKIPEFVHVVHYKKAGIPKEIKDNIEKNKDKVTENKKEIDISDIEIKETEEIEYPEKEKNNIKEVTKIAGAISLGAASLVVLPTVVKTVAAVEALKVLTENDKEYNEKPEESKVVPPIEDEEIVELIEKLEEENIESKEEEILKENGLEEEIKKEQNDSIIENEEISPITKEERFKILKMNFENNEENKKETKVLRVKEELKTKKEVKKKKQELKKKQEKQKTKKPSALKRFVSKIGRVAFLLSMNITLASILEKQATKTLVAGKPKVLK